MYNMLCIIFPNAKRGFSTFLEGSLRSAPQCCSGRSSALSETDPDVAEFVDFPEFVEFPANAGRAGRVFPRCGL